MRGSNFDPLRPSTMLGNSSRPITGLDLRETTNGGRRNSNTQQEADWEEMMDVKRFKNLLNLIFKIFLGRVGSARNGHGTKQAVQEEGKLCHHRSKSD